ncbi:proline dehydrogenase, partial [Zunongwangia sp. F297]|nr:proline dehydrogenase [Zunongwangia sp. F297]
MIRKKIFNNTATAFKLKSDLELDRAIFLFSMMNRQRLVKAGTFLTKFSLKLHLPVEGMIKKTIFEQFCGGIHKEDCKEVITEMHEEKLHSILDYSVEGKETEEQFDAALEKKLSLIKFADKKAELPFSVFKPTGIGRFAIWEKVTEKVSLNEA